MVTQYLFHFTEKNPCNASLALEEFRRDYNAAQAEYRKLYDAADSLNDEISEENYHIGQAEIEGRKAFLKTIERLNTRLYDAAGLSVIMVGGSTWQQLLEPLSV